MHWRGKLGYFLPLDLNPPPSRKTVDFGTDFSLSFFFFFFFLSFFFLLFFFFFFFLFFLRAGALVHFGP